MRCYYGTHSVSQAVRWFTNLSLPAWQRHYCWAPDDAVELFRSIRAGLPIGQIVIWKDYASGRTLLVDGQQRLTTLVGSYLPRTAVNTENAPISRVLYSPKLDDFVLEGVDDDSMAIYDMRDINKMLRDMDKHPGNEARLRAVCQVADAIDGYTIPYCELVGTADEVREAFHRMNRFGRPIQDIDTLLAQAEAAK